MRRRGINYWVVTIVEEGEDGAGRGLRRPRLGALESFHTLAAAYAGDADSS